VHSWGFKRAHAAQQAAWARKGWQTNKEAGLLKGSKAAAEGYTQAYLDDCNRYDRGAVESLAKASK
jgi:hypothetical protein